MAIGNGFARGGLNVDMNVTPLIDVLLVLLIVFMVIVPVPPRGLDTQIPQPSANSNHNQDAAVLIQIRKAQAGQPRYTINQDPLPLGELENRLRAILSLRANRATFIKADASLDFSAVAQVLDIAKSAGADHIGLITPKDEI
jgi:biopolymer transport protein TolR